MNARDVDASLGLQPEVKDKPTVRFFPERKKKKKPFVHRHLMVILPHYSLGSVPDQQVDGTKGKTLSERGKLGLHLLYGHPSLPTSLTDLCAVLVTCLRAPFQVLGV